ncbi:translation initiation factor IF-3 [Centruroides vittatus]|uniref:translation initiation factor IF-3 n=1 Tax=Centruroides vittatus TaxID=120091 RepID=UPI00350FA212
MATLVCKHVLNGTSSSKLFPFFSRSFLYLSTYNISLKKNFHLTRCIYLTRELSRISVPILRQIFNNLSTGCVNYSKASNEDKDSEKIILLGHDDKVLGIRMKSEAELLANKKDMKLIKKDDEATQYKRYPVYQLIRKDQMFKEKSNKINKPKNQKQITISCKILDHDLNVKLKNIERWLKKEENEVFLIITGEEEKKELMEKVYSKIENNFKNDAKFVQKVVKKQYIKVYIIPVKESDPEPQSDQNKL